MTRVFPTYVFMDRRLALLISLLLRTSTCLPPPAHHSPSFAASPKPLFTTAAPPSLPYLSLTLTRSSVSFLCFRMLSSDSGNSAKGFLSKSSSPTAAAARKRRVKQLLTKPHTKSCSRGGREPKPSSSHPPKPSGKMDPRKSNPEASSSSSTPFRRLDGDINREAGIPLTGQDIVGRGNKARGVNCSAHGSISVIGRRREMEDRLTVAPSDFPKTHDFFGVYDGHGGARVSAACRDLLHTFVGERIEKWNGGGDFDWVSVMKECFRKMDEEVNAEEGGGSGLGMGVLGGELVRPPKMRTDGSTALVVVLSKDEIVVANCGDSRAVLFRNGTVLPLLWDQKPDESRRVEAAGGKVIDLKGLLVPGVPKATRTIGDQDLKPYMICEPELVVSKCTELDKFLIIASDGLWDAVSSEDACEVVKKCLDGQTRRRLPGESTKNPGVAAAMLAELAVAKGSKDNISVIVVELKNKYISPFGP